MNFVSLFLHGFNLLLLLGGLAVGVLAVVALTLAIRKLRKA